MGRRLDPNAPVTYGDLIHPITRKYPIKVMSEDEFDTFTPKTSHKNWRPPDDWPRTGYLSPHPLLVGRENIVVWVFTEFVSTSQVQGDFGMETRFETKQYLVYVNGQPVIEWVEDPYA